MIGMLRAGNLDRRITFQTIVPGQGSDYSEPTAPATDWKTVWASAAAVGGGERYRGHQVSAECTMVFECRWFSELTATMLIRYDGRTYDILRFSEIGRRVGYLIEAQGRVE